jgi:hypothetical protein
MLKVELFQGSLRAAKKAELTWTVAGLNLPPRHWPVNSTTIKNIIPARSVPLVVSKPCEKSVQPVSAVTAYSGIKHQV